MAEKSVGTIAAKVVANVDDFHKGIDSALRKAENFGTHAGRALTAPFSGIAGAISAPLKALEGFGGPLQGALSGIPLIGAAFAAIPISASAFLDYLKEGREMIIEQERLAVRLGVSMKEAAAFHTLGGGRSDEFEKAIQHMMRKQDELGLGGMGTTEAYRTVTAQIKAMGDAAQRGTAIQEVFGKGGSMAADIFLKEGDALAVATSMVEKYGLTVDEATVKEIKRQELVERGLKQMAKGFQMQAAGKASTFWRQFISPLWRFSPWV